MKVRIVQCSSDRFWYSDHIGEEFTFIRQSEDDGCYIVVDYSNYSNIVLFEDGTIVNDDEYEELCLA